MRWASFSAALAMPRNIMRTMAAADLEHTSLLLLYHRPTGLIDPGSYPAGHWSGA